MPELNVLEQPAATGRRELLPASDLPALYERFDWSWFDSITIPNGNTATQFRVFTTRQAKSPQQTNMVSDGHIPRPEMFDTLAVCIQPEFASPASGLATPTPNPPANIATILTGTFQLNVSSKAVIERTPMFVFTAGGGIDGASGLTSNAPVSFRFGQNGLPTPFARFNLFIPIHVVYDEALEGIITYDTAPSFTNDTRLFVYLAGIRYRAAQ